jgi:twitching motility two-component system response regulator PilG
MAETDKLRHVVPGRTVPAGQPGKARETHACTECRTRIARAKGEEERQMKAVWVIDDSSTVRAIVEISLNRAGYTVWSFSDGVEALRALSALTRADVFQHQSQRKPSGVPDLVFVDLSLPKMDGYEVIQQMKQKPLCTHTTFVVLSRRDGQLDKLKGHLAGARDYITKPFKAQYLIETACRLTGTIQPVAREKKRLRKILLILI